MNDKKTGIPLLRPFLGVLLSVWLLFSCGQRPTEDEKKDDTEAIPTTGNVVNLTEGQYRNADIELGKVERRTLSHYLTVNGVLDVPPENLVSISAPMGGFLKSTHLLPGSRVKKGQTIAVIEHPDYIQLQQDYLDSKSRLAFAALEYQRQGELNQEHVNSDKVFQQSTADYQVLQHRVKSLEEKLRLIGLNPAQLSSDRISRSIPIRTPISGYVKTVNVNLGKYVNPSDVLFDIVDTQHMHLALSVFEKDIPRVRVKQKVLFHLPSEPEKVRTGSVHLVGKALEADKTVMVHVHLNQDDPTLLPGMYVNARIETSDSTAYTLPNGAIVHSEGTYFIFVPGKEQPRTYKSVPVTKGLSEHGYTAVSLPAEVIPHQTPVVVKGAYALLSKMMNVEEEE